MRPDQIEAAADALRKVRRYADDADALLPYSVTAITLSRGDGSGGLMSDIELSRGRGGTGSVSSIGYPDDLREALTAALHQWAAARVAKARADARESGVQFDD